MKKILIGIVAVVVVLGIGATTAFAGGFSQQAHKTTCPNYLDVNGDGVCDHCTNPMSNTLNNDGKPNSTQGACNNYIDANNNNVCDNAEANRTCTNTNKNVNSGNHHGQNNQDGGNDGLQHRHHRGHA